MEHAHPPAAASAGVLGDILVVIASLTCCVLLAAFVWRRWLAPRAAQLREVNAALRRELEARTRELGHAGFALRNETVERQRAEKERDESTAAARAARAEAEQAKRFTEELVGTLSHELRGPLNAILGWSQLLQSGSAESVDVARGVEVIERNARAQTQLLEEVLDLCALGAGKLQLDITHVDLSVVVDAALQGTKPAADAKQIQLLRICEPGPAVVMGDFERLRQMLGKLLANAVKLTPSGGEVRLRLRRRDHRVEIAVSDTGRGIKPELLPHVFERVGDEDAAAARRHNGLGLGLSVVRALVELHGGVVRADSAGENLGATFTIELPLANVASLRPDGKSIGVPVQSSATATASLAGLTVLVVDDDGDARKTVKHMLEGHGAVAVCAGSALEALQVLSLLKPDVLVSDLGMPERDGYELIRTVRALPRGNIPAVALSGLTQPADRARALAAGYQVHLAKPVEPAELVSTLATVTGRLAGRLASVGS